jgi:hypothetical protein
MTSAQHIQKGRLARTGWTHNRDKLARIQIAVTSRHHLLEGLLYLENSRLLVLNCNEWQAILHVCLASYRQWQIVICPE